MASELDARRGRRAPWLLLLLFPAWAAWGGGLALLLNAPEPASRPLVLCALLGLGLLMLSLTQLRRLRRMGQPLQALAEPAPSAAQREAQQQQLQLLEAVLDAAPVALWRVEGDRLLALNGQARRLLAPGSRVDAQRLRSLLLAELPEAQAGHRLIELGELPGEPIEVADGSDAAQPGGEERWLLRERRLVLQGRSQRLLALMPMESELQAEAQRSWRELVRVLTHEIMNSLTPISSLSRSALDMLADPQAGDELGLALEAVARRAEALGRFVGDYRRISDWPAPQMAPVDLRALLARLQQMEGPAWTARGGRFSIELQPESLMLMADEGQLEQALLNLIRNAEQATAGLDAPRLELRARLGQGGRLLLSVTDNGPGVPAGLERQIFLPFFSARGPDAQGQRGSGIGLAVVRQLIHGMGGSVRHVRPLQGGASFVLRF